MKNNVVTFIILLASFFLIAISFFYAKRSALTCPKCGSKDNKKTGNSKKIGRSRRALIASPLPADDYEYKCLKCGYTFWNSIESMWRI